ncbi:DDX54 [Hepatospora eriocheir]|uniref:RNA helicase n=1 Tax=Hepatospora eriocheir TaxID=1081669 RepID=A0A1X0QC21_9MICR|nr:DDX54 [Hepatospora eriocheir]
MTIKKLKGGSFKTLDLNFKLLENIPFNNPTPIQRKTLPDILDGKSLMVIARTGSGKTLCYLIPAIERALEGKNSLILLPTKELVIQVKGLYKKLTKKLKHEGKIDIMTLKSDFDASIYNFCAVDEFDRILEEPSLNEHFEKISEKLNCQKIYLSATLPNDPIDMKMIMIETKIPETITHSFYYVPSDCKEAALLNLIDKNKRTIIFTATRYSVDLIVAVLEKYNYESKGIYSSMDDEARRSHFNMFIQKQINFLVVTDVAARGLTYQN